MNVFNVENFLIIYYTHLYTCNMLPDTLNYCLNSVDHLANIALCQGYIFIQDIIDKY